MAAWLKSCWMTSTSNVQVRKWNSHAIKPFPVQMWWVYMWRNKNQACWRVNNTSNTHTERVDGKNVKLCNIKLEAELVSEVLSYFRCWIQWVLSWNRSVCSWIASVCFCDSERGFGLALASFVLISIYMNDGTWSELTTAAPHLMYVLNLFSLRSNLFIIHGSLYEC